VASIIFEPFGEFPFLALSVESLFVHVYHISAFPTTSGMEEDTSGTTHGPRSTEIADHLNMFWTRHEAEKAEAAENLLRLKEERKALRSRKREERSGNDRNIFWNKSFASSPTRFR
jgi:hypothetical protein